MNTRDPSLPPDFLLERHSASIDSKDKIYCVSPEDRPSIEEDEEFRTALGILHTDTTHIEVTKINWTEPTTIVFTPHRPGFCSLISSSSPMEYGYGSEPTKPGSLGRILFMLPGREIRSHNLPGVIRAVTCSFDPQYAEQIMGPLGQFSQSQLLNSLDVRSSLISAILLRLMHEALYPGALSNAVVESFGHAMLVECAHCLTEDVKEHLVGGLTARHFAIIDEYLAGLSGTLPSVSELAAVCGLSERYFAKIFRQQTGCSIAQYMKSAQITKAKSYLLETDLPLKEIAYRLGFSTASNFSSAFRTATGITPGQFRKNPHS